MNKREKGMSNQLIEEEKKKIQASTYIKQNRKSKTKKYSIKTH